ncbi:CRE-DHS-27 protein [Aphelenchoides avenae]|nr:CRE-DHS-27 protein [Aphelenchus avenae]
MDEAAKLAFVARAHNGECEFYETFKRVDDFPIPTVWFTRKLIEDGSSLPAYILMEDLSGRGASLNITASVTLTQIKNVARHLAALHADVLCNGLRSKPIEGFVYPVELDVDSMFKLGAKELVRIDAEAFKVPLEKLEHIGSCAFNKHALIERPKELGLPPLLCHDDLWIGNMLFEKSPNGKASDRILAIIDWQTAFNGNPMLDLAQFICICADSAVRREAEHEHFVIKYYHAELIRHMALEGKVPPYDILQLTEAYKLAFLTQASQFVVNVPFMTGGPLKEIVPEEDYEAQLARIVSNGRRLLEDAVSFLDAVARPFLDKAIC